MDWWFKMDYVEFDDKDNRPLMGIVDERHFYMDGASRENYRLNFCPSCGHQYVNKK